MSSPRAGRSTRRGLVALAAALGLGIASYAWSPFWSAMLANARGTPATLDTLRLVWMPLASVALMAVTALLGLAGFVLVWRGRYEYGGEYASRVGLGLLAGLVATAAFGLYGLTGILLGYVAALSGLAPWHALFFAVGGIALGFALYWILANLPLSGTRPLALVAFALGVAGIVLVNLAVMAFRRGVDLSLGGAGVAFAFASLLLWLVLCLYGEESLKGHGLSAAGTRAAESP